MEISGTVFWASENRPGLVPGGTGAAAAAAAAGGGGWCGAGDRQAWVGTGVAVVPVHNPSSKSHHETQRSAERVCQEGD